MPELPYRDYLSYSKEDQGTQTDSANTGRLATGKKKVFLSYSTGQN